MCTISFFSFVSIERYWLSQFQHIEIFLRQRVLIKQQLFIEKKSIKINQFRWTVNASECRFAVCDG